MFTSLIFDQLVFENTASSTLTQASLLRPRKVVVILFAAFFPVTFWMIMFLLFPFWRFKYSSGFETTYTIVSLPFLDKSNDVI
ncbi:hypothetical protein D3C85_1320550 [compost metagenome]